MTKRQELLKTLSPVMQLDAARNHGELRDALGVIINDMMSREREPGAAGGKKYDMGMDAAFVLGMIYGKMRSFQEAKS